MSVVFTEEQLEQARSIPRKSMDTVVASATDTPVSYWRELRVAGRAPNTRPA